MCFAFFVPNKKVMAHNVGFTDMVLRYFIMMIVMILAGVFQSVVLVILGVLIFMTAISAWCPLYQLLRIKT